jgi:hypothetical protein
LVETVWGHFSSLSAEEGGGFDPVRRGHGRHPLPARGVVLGHGKVAKSDTVRLFARPDPFAVLSHRRQQLPDSALGQQADA